MFPQISLEGKSQVENKEIKNFCETNFNITFPMTDKVDVKGSNAHPIYIWAKDNYGISTIPKWNFHKILINRDGKIHETFSSFTAPLSKKIINEIEGIVVQITIVYKIIIFIDDKEFINQKVY